MIDSGERRVRVNDSLSMVFVGSDAVAEDFVPEDPGVLATLYVDAADAAGLAAVLASYGQAPQHTYLDVAGERATARLLSDPGDDSEPAAAWAIWFPLSEGQRRAWHEGAEVSVAIEVPGRAARVSLTPEQRRRIAADI